MPRPSKLPALTYTKIAALAETDVRTAKAYYEGAKVTRPAIARSIRIALVQLNIPDPHGEAQP